MHTAIFAQATNEFQKSKKNVIFQKMRNKSTFVEISKVWCFCIRLDQSITNST